MSRIAGTRYKSRKLPGFTKVEGRRLYWVEITREELHVTKGWRGKHVFKRAMDHHMWVQHPATQEFFFPNDGWPAEKLPNDLRVDRLTRRLPQRAPPPRKGREVIHAWQRKKAFWDLIRGRQAALELEEGSYATL